MLEAEDNSLKPSPRTKFWRRGQLVLEDLTSLVVIIVPCLVNMPNWGREVKRRHYFLIYHNNKIGIGTERRKNGGMKCNDRSNTMPDTVQ